MLRLITSGYSVRLVVFLVFIFTAGCVSLKTIPVNNINELQSGRKFLKVHSEDSLWVIDQYQVNGIVLTGKLVKNPSDASIFKRADIYIASSNSVKIEGDIFNLSIDNIGKVDYQVVDGLLVIASIGIIIVTILFSPLFFR